MSRFHSYLQTAEFVIDAYTGNEPFAAALKKYYAANKKHGGRDRRMISHLCYCYFRLGRAFESVSRQERMLTGLFLSALTPDDLLETVRPEWNDKVQLSVYEKLMFLSGENEVGKLFPFTDELSKGIDHELFSLSHLQQPGLFLRIRPGYKEQIINRLKSAGIPFQQPATNIVLLPNGTKTEELFRINKEVVVQDYSSQQAGELLQLVEPLPKAVWDCCAASGGKSIMANDRLPGIQLTVSDIRESILVNLKARFKEAGIGNYQSRVVDLSEGTVSDFEERFDLIIADVPCSGSGTWGRTPEYLTYFKKEQIDVYSSLQNKIVTNALPALKKNGYLLYITCSVYAKENEQQVALLAEAHQLRIIEQRLLTGYDKKADTMFAALLTKP